MLATTSIQRTCFFLLLFFLVFAGLYYAKPFLVPVCFGGLLAMLFLPVSHWFRRKNIPKGLAVLFCVLIFLLIITAIIWLISWQVTDLTSEVSSIEQKVKESITEVKDYINKNFGLSPKQQDELLQNSGPGEGSRLLANVGSSLMSFVVDFILVVVYIFLFMFYSTHIKQFILKLVPAQQKKNAEVIIHDIQKVSQQYLSGLGLMIVCLWVMYSIGFSIAGVQYPIFFAILCGLLEIVPFIGNLTGNILTILMSVIQGGGMQMVVAILITYAIIQFLQTYLLEPLVVGSEVNINPLFTIIILVIGELVWGIPGMVLAIPLLGIAKIICDHIEPLKPYGFLIGTEKKKKKSWIDRLKKGNSN